MHEFTRSEYQLAAEADNIMFCVIFFVHAHGTCELFLHTCEAKLCVCSHYCVGALMEKPSSFPLCHSSGPPEGLKQEGMREGEVHGGHTAGERPRSSNTSATVQTSLESYAYRGGGCRRKRERSVV